MISFSLIFTSNWKWSQELHFGLPAHNSSVQFSDWLYFDSFTWNDINASEITFQGLKKPSYILYQSYNFSLIYNASASTLFINSSEGIPNQSYYVGVERLMYGMRYEAISNGTLSAQSENGGLRRLMCTVTVIHNKSQVQVYTAGYRPRYVKVAGSYLSKSEWVYNRKTKILLFNVTGSPPHRTEAIFGITDEEGVTAGVLGSLMAAFASFRKKIASFNEKHRKLIERGLILALILVVVIIVVWFSGIYAGWF